MLNTDFAQLENSHPGKCSICGASIDKFMAHRDEVELRQCSVCRSLERQRVFKSIYDSILKNSNADMTGKRLLHVSPAVVERRLFTEFGLTQIVTLDLRPAVKTDITADLCHMPEVSDESFDVVFASYVLNFVHDDNAALREICRILMDNGNFITYVEECKTEKTVIQRGVAVTKNYTEEALAEYNIGYFREYGSVDFPALLSNYFDVQMYRQADWPTQNLCTWYICTKKKASRLSKILRKLKKQ